MSRLPLRGAGVAARTMPGVAMPSSEYAPPVIGAGRRGSPAGYHPPNNRLWRATAAMAYDYDYQDEPYEGGVLVVGWC